MAKRKKNLRNYFHNKTLLIVALIAVFLGFGYYFNSVKNEESSKLPSAYQGEGAAGTVNTIQDNSSESGMIPVALAAGSSRVLFYLEYAGRGNNPNNPHAYNIISYNLVTKQSILLNKKTPVDAPIEIASANQGYLIYSNGQNELFRINVATGETTQITSSYVGPYPISISPDEQKIAFFKYEGKSRVAAIYNISTLEQEKSYIVSGDTINNRIIWSPSGGSLFVVNVRSINEVGVNDIMELTDKYPEGTTVINTDTAKSQISFQPNSGKLLYIENAPGSEESNLVEYDLATNQSRTIETGQTGYNSFSGYVISPDGQKMYYTRGDQGLTEMGVGGGKKATILTQVQSTPYLRLIGFGNNENELIISSLATTKEGTQKEFYNLYNLSTNELTEIVSSDTPSKGN